MKNDIAISVKNVTKDFHLPRHKSDSLKQTITQVFKPKDKAVDVHHALKGISFDIKKGEFFGVLGRNGSGKSTLLKIISEIYRPTSGSVTHNGTLVSFIELGVGFKAELSGRENVYLNGALLGFSKKEIDERYDEIVAFAELEDFMEQKIKNYSSGMKVRLAFAVAIQAKSEILVLDEVLAVGDAAFQKKCYEYFKSLKEDKSKTIVFVTHGMGAVREYCTRAVVIKDGKVQFEGSADEAADEYMNLFNDTKKVPNSSSSKVVDEIELKNISIKQDNKSIKSVRFRKNFSIVIDLFSKTDYKDVTIGVHIFDQSGRDIIAISSNIFDDVSIKNGSNSLKFDVQNILKDGSYHVNFAIEEKNTKRLLVQRHELAPFSVVGLDKTQHSRHSLVYPEVKFRHD